MARITLDNYRHGTAASDEQCRRLECGDILYFPRIPFAFPIADQKFLLGQKQTAGSLHKNVSYRPAQDRLTGIDQRDGAERTRVHAVMQAFSQNAISFLAAFFPSYAQSWKVDFASYRPLEEQGRDVSQRSRNDLIHVDNFPSRPSNGDRLLRVFANINPERPRVWVTSDSFEALARRYAREVGLPQQPGLIDRLRGAAIDAMARTGLPVVNRPPYDRFMLTFPPLVTENAEFQPLCTIERWPEPPGSSWIVFTDTTSHACISGQYALEQTMIVRHESLVYPEKAPITVLGELAGFPLRAGLTKAA